ncbi:MAG: hypothetical protein IJ665_03105 [Phocaeicola sp.]|nr:hypothetical protein [Phocaeicola sp.]MBR1595664.1 hypothetical protein [Phocaeicola sp.]
MDILFIIGMILFFVLSTKKEKKQSTTSTPRPKKDVFEDVFPDIKEWSKPETPKHAKESEPFLREEINKPITPSTDRKKMKPSVQPIVTKEDEPCEDFRLQDVDEARRAFIYSEIFNRKYE